MLVHEMLHSRMYHLLSMDHSVVRDKNPHTALWAPDGCLTRFCVCLSKAVASAHLLGFRLGRLRSLCFRRCCSFRESLVILLGIVHRLPRSRRGRFQVLASLVTISTIFRHFWHTGLLSGQCKACQLLNSIIFASRWIKVPRGYLGYVGLCGRKIYGFAKLLHRHLHCR